MTSVEKKLVGKNGIGNLSSFYEIRGGIYEGLKQISLHCFFFFTLTKGFRVELSLSAVSVSLGAFDSVFRARPFFRTTLWSFFFLFCPLSFFIFFYFLFF